ncbi:MAG: N-acetyltransferase [Gaiellales bacterium]|jgi:RimJ/RimL family protein N-acetyltransferase|nr:N-acetyltransferase [Gaiellales bacterium]MDX6545193.1 N-acetyltransferase [Gaiellales bacterium]
MLLRMPMLDLFDQPPTLEGSLVRMEPLAERHREPLCSALSDPSVWRWVKIDASADRAAYDEWFDQSLTNTAGRSEFTFATVRRSDAAVVGTSRYLSFRPADQGLEIGYTLVAPAAWGSGANSEAKLLMLEHAFERLGCVRVEFKTDARNERARAALAALPSGFEGIFRKHMLMFGGRWRDSAWYAITDEEWPQTKLRLQERLAAQLPRQGTR